MRLCEMLNADRNSPFTGSKPVGQLSMNGLTTLQVFSAQGKLPHLSPGEVIDQLGLSSDARLPAASSSLPPGRCRRSRLDRCRPRHRRRLPQGCVRLHRSEPCRRGKCRLAVFQGARHEARQGGDRRAAGCAHAGPAGRQWQHVGLRSEAPAGDLRSNPPASFRRKAATMRRFCPATTRGHRIFGERCVVTPPTSRNPRTPRSSRSRTRWRTRCPEASPRPVPKSTARCPSCWSGCWMPTRRVRGAPRHSSRMHKGSGGPTARPFPGSCRSTKPMSWAAPC